MNVILKGGGQTRKSGPFPCLGAASKPPCDPNMPGDEIGPFQGGGRHGQKASAIEPAVPPHGSKS